MYCFWKDFGYIEYGDKEEGKKRRGGIRDYYWIRNKFGGM